MERERDRQTKLLSQDTEEKEGREKKYIVDYREPLPQDTRLVVAKTFNIFRSLYTLSSVIKAIACSQSAKGRYQWLLKIFQKSFY